MRSAPKWRAFVPTGRQIRFAAMRWVAALSPSLAHRWHLHLSMGGWELAETTTIKRWDLKAERPLPHPLVEGIEAEFALDMQVCGGVCHADPRTMIELRRFGPALVFGHSAQAVDRASGLSITAVNRNQARPARLRETRIEGLCLNLLDVRPGKQQYYFFYIKQFEYRWKAAGAAAALDQPVTVLLSPTTKANELAFRAMLAKRYPALKQRVVATDACIACDGLLQALYQRDCVYRGASSEVALEETVSVFREAFGITPSVRPERLLYLSRRDAGIRRIRNEEALEAMLARHGFESVTATDYDHAGQVRLFGEARAVIGAHGAGLTNIIFMAPGGALMELFGRGYVQGAYLWLAHLRGHDYAWHIADMTYAKQDFALSDGDLSAIEAWAVRVASGVVAAPDAVAGPAAP
ncbi:MAG: glycosyltransferase family 61 protein [Pseudomonadota bacterium]